MKILLFHLAVLGCTVAVPSGYYHQEYNYKTSASSFKNNELQHKTDDQGYYRKDGDLDGRVKPVVDANSEHSEYVNPNSQGGQSYGGANTDFSSTGNMRAQNGYNGYGSNALEAEGLARSDRIVGSTGYSSGSDTGFSSTGNMRSQSGYNGYGSHALDAERLAQSGRIIGSTGYSSGYGSNSLGSHSQSYGTSSNLRQITSRLQQELESDLQEAVRQNNIYPQTRVDISQLERELKQNLTERLNNELTAKFGQQMVRGGMSYTITGGRLQSTANYDNEELSNLRSQLENSLMNQLRNQYSSSSSSNSQYYNRQSSYGYTTTVRPVYNSVYPSLPSYTSTVRYPVDYNHANYQTVRYTPITNPQSITNIASRVQNQLDTRLNEVLDETRRKYFSSGASYSLTNTDVLLERIRNELRSNLTYLLDDDIRRNYGTQIQRDGYLYSVGPSGQTSTDYNYSLRDLENLKQQVERNLIEKLNRDFETHRSSWSSHQSYNSQSSYGSNYQYSSTPRYYEVVTTPRQSYVNPYPASTSHQGGYIKTGSGASNQYDYATGSQQSGYGIQSSGSIAQLQRQLQDDLSRQLRGALSTGHYTSHSSNGVYSPQNYQTTLQQLSDDLNRNLTRHLQEYSAMGSYAAYGNFDSAQMQRLKTQLQDSLMSQLQQGLQQSYQASSSYSSSSSSSSNSNYRPVRGFQDYQAGQYRSGLETVAGEDCAGDDPNAYSHVRAKRSYRFLSGTEDDQSQSQQILHLGLYQGNRRSSHNYQHLTDVGQELDDYDSTQQIENSGFGRYSNFGQSHDGVGHRAEYRRNEYSQDHDQTEGGQQIDDNDDYENGKLQVSHLGQQVDDSDLTQQVEDSHYGKVLGQGQHIYDSDLTQQVEDSGYGKLQVSNQGQQIDNSYLTQQVEDSDYRKLQISNQRQQVDDSDLIPQGQDSGYEKLLVSNQGQQIDNSYLTQQVDDSDYRKLQISNQGQQVDDSDLIPQGQDSGEKLIVSNKGQQVDDSDSTQQVEDFGNGKLQIPNQGQQVDDSYLSQQVEDSDYRKLQVLNQGQQVDDSDSIQQVQNSGKFQVSNQGQYVDDADLTQQVEDSGYGKLQNPNQSQQVDDSYLTQQVEDSDYRKLPVLNQGQQVDDSDSIQQVQNSGKFQVSNQGQYVDDADLTQQVENSGYGKLQIPNQGQQVDDSYLTQQVEDSDYRKLQISNQGQQVDDSASFPQVQNSGKLQVLNQGQQVDDADLTQQVEDSFLTQQVEDSDYRKLQISNQGQQVDDSASFPQVQNSGKLQVLNQGQQVDDADLTQQVEDSFLTQQVEDSDYRKLQISNQGQQVDDSASSPQVQNSGKLQVSNQVQNVDDADLAQQVEDSDHGKLQISNEGQHLDSTQQVEESGYGKLPVSSQSPLITSFGKQTDSYGLNQEQEHNSGFGRHHPQPPAQLIHGQVNDLDSTQQVEHVEFGEHHPQYSDHFGDDTEDSNKRHNDLHFGQHLPQQKDLSQQVGQSTHGKPEISRQGQNYDSVQHNSFIQHEIPSEQQIHKSDTYEHHSETGQQIDNSDDPNAKFNVRDQTHQTNSVHEVPQQVPKVELGQQVEDSELMQQVVEQEQISEFGQQVEDKRPIEPEKGQQTEKPEFLRKNQVFSQNEPVTVQTGSKTSNLELCSKYIDTSLMDVPWQLSNQFKGEIVKQYQPLAHGITNSQKDQLYQKILAGLPKNIMYHCFKVLDINLNQQSEDEQVKELESYFRYLINQEIDDIIKRENENNDQKLNQIPEKSEVPTTNESGSANKYENIEKWCSKYIDTSLMDAPWTLSSQLEEEINREYHLLADGTTESQKNILYKKILTKLPSNIMYTCFQVDGMKVSKREEDEIVEGLENYFKSLIQQKIDNVVPDDKKLEVTTVNGSGLENENNEKWCSKYIDTSLMDTSWTLSSQLEEEINREYHLLADDTTESQKNILYKKILTKLPSNIMYTCFQVDGMKVSKREEYEIVEGLETYFKSLIKQKIDNVVPDDPKVEATENKNQGNQELDDSLRQQEIEPSFKSIEDWCTKYIDKSLMDAPWKLGIQLKSTISKQCSRTIRNGGTSSELQYVYERALNEIPTNITDCFNMQDMGLNEVQLAEKRHDIETYLKSLMKNEVVTTCKLEDNSLSQKQDILGQVESNDNSPKIEYNPVPLETLLPGKTTQKSTMDESQYPQTHSTNEIRRPSKVNELLPSNQFIENDPKRGENLPQPQIINGLINEVNVPQSLTPSSSNDLIQPNQSKAKSFEITDQGQFFHRPQTVPEAEHTADSLIDALRNSQTDRHNQQTINEYRGYGYRGRQSYDSYGYRSHVYDNSRPFGRPHGYGYSHYPKYNRPGYDNKPTGYNPRPYPGSYGSNPYQTSNIYGYSHQPPRYNKPLNYGEIKVVEQNVETTSDIEPVRTGQINFINHVKPVYSGVKGRSRHSGSSYQPALPHPRPSQVQLEPVAIQEIVRQDGTAPQAVHEITPLTTNNENLSWWKRFGNKVKQGAADLKNKIIGG